VATFEARDAGPHFRKEGNNSEPQWFVDLTRANCAFPLANHVAQLLWREFSEVATPVRDRRHARAAGVQHKAGARGTEVNNVVRVIR
jgi:hypothetical protein